MTRLGLGSYAYAWAIGVPGYSPPQEPMNPLAFVRQANSLGLTLVQIADNLPLERLSDHDLDTLQLEVRQLHIDVEIGTRGIGHEHLRTHLQLARRFQSPILRVVVETASHHPAPDEIVSTLRGILPEFEQAGITLAIENHDRFRATTLKEIFLRLDSAHIGICLDTVNSFGALEGPELVVSTLGPHVVNLHVKDFMISRADHHMGFVVEGRPAGQGMLDIPWLLRKLRSYGREFNAILELWPPPEANVAHTIQKEDVWVAQSIEYLKPLVGDLDDG